MGVGERRTADLSFHGDLFGWDTWEQILAAEARVRRLIAPEPVGNGRGGETNLVVSLRTGVPGFRRMPSGGPFLPEAEIVEIVA